MPKTAPSLPRIAAMALFALSCFGLLLFLWVAFGGPVPLKPQGYRFKASFAEATQLADEADVRISGVPVGRVTSVRPDPRTGRSLVEIELRARYAPLPSDARATLRQKTLLGETYVELTPGSKGARPLPENGLLPATRISDTVELDEILRALDPATRRAFQVWMQAQAGAIGNRGRDLNDALGNLGPFAEDASDLVDVLNRQEGAVRALVRDTGTVLAALSERDGQLRDLVASSQRVFGATARRNRELRAAVVALPTFEREARATVQRLDAFARRTDPLVTQLRPAARELSPALEGVAALAPDLRTFFRGLGPLTSAARRGLPATERILDDLRPLAAQLDPTSRQLVPILAFVGLYKPELTAFLANTVASTQAFEVVDGRQVKYLRTTNPLNPENLAVYARRIGSNRTNPYVRPGGFRELAAGRGLESFETRHCGRPDPAIAPAAKDDPAPVSSAPAGTAGGAGGEVVNPLDPSIPRDPVLGVLANEAFVRQVERFAFPRAPVPAPPCREQPPYGTAPELTRYPHVGVRPGSR